MTVKAADDDGNEFTFRATGGIAKYRMDDDFKTERIRTLTLKLIRRRARELGMPLIDMEEVAEKMRDIQAEDGPKTVDIPVEDKVTGRPIEIEVHVSDKMPVDEVEADEGAFGQIEIDE